VKLGQLVLGDGRQLRSASGRIALTNGRLKLGALQATLGGAAVKLDGGIGDPRNFAGFDFKLAVQGAELAELFKFFGRTIAPVGPYQGNAQLQGSLAALRMTAIDASAGVPRQRLRVKGQIEDANRGEGLQLAISANVSDSAAAGRLFGVEVPRLPPLRLKARLSGPKGGYVLDDLSLSLGRSSATGRAVFVPGEPRPRLTAKLAGPLADLSELPLPSRKQGATNPLLAADIDASIRFDRVTLPGRRALGAVSGDAALAAGRLELTQFSVAVDGASAIIDGAIKEPLAAAGLDLAVSAKVARGTGLAVLTGMQLEHLPPFTASGKLTDTPGGYALGGMKLVHAAATISGDVAVTRSAKRYKVSAKASAPLLDVAAFLRPAAARDKAAPEGAGARLIPDVPLPLDLLRGFDADVDLRADAIRYGDAAPLGPLQLQAALADGVLKAESVQLAIKPGQVLRFSGSVDAAQALWALRAEGSGIDLGELVARFEHPGLVTGGSIDLALQARGRGKTLPAVLGSLDGSLRVTVGPHRVHNFALNLDTGIFFRTFRQAVKSRDSGNDTEVKCFAAHVPIGNGILTSTQNVALETAGYNAVLNGTLNLRSETIDVAVTPIVTGGRGIGMGEVNVIVRVRGPLASPTVGVDTAGIAMQSAASLGAAVLTLGGSRMMDALIRQAASDPNPCATALILREAARSGPGKP
jgi:uncharacterized protein involved in outer membrane biogenesis